MPTNIMMPSSMENGTLARWLKSEGDRIQLGDILAEVETDKALMELEALHEGVLSKIIIPEGTADLAADTVLAILASSTDKEVVSVQATETAEPQVPSVHHGAFAEELYSMESESLKADPVGHAVETYFTSEVERSGRIFASPRARRLAGEAGIELTGLRGSGPGGRIIERDIEAAKTNGSRLLAEGSTEGLSEAETLNAPPKSPQGALLTRSGAQIKADLPPNSFVEVPHDGMRRSIARRLLEAKQTIPHFYLSMGCELDALLSLKNELNQIAIDSLTPLENGVPAYKLSLNDLLIKAWARALAKVPEANVSWTESALLKYRHVDVGVAVAFPGGLITPIVKHADTKILSVISNEMKDLTARAKARKLKSEEYEGGTTTISNLGMFGTKSFSAILNPPQATILAVGAGERRIVIKDNRPAVATVIFCTLSVDHRAVDGAVAAQVFAEFKRSIEHPVRLLA